MGGSPIVLPTLGQTMQISRLPIVQAMPPEGESFRFAAYVAIPAQGAQSVVVQFPVPQGVNAMIKRVANVYVGGGFQEGQGLITWQLYVDFQQGVVAPNFDNILASLGAVSNPPLLDDGIRARENQLVTLLVKNANPGVVPAGQLIGGLISGYFYPVDLEPVISSF
jgi:hypothetical protein